MSNPKIEIKTTKLPNSRIAIEFEIPANKCKLSIEETLSKLARSATIPGFRKGKVPKAVIMQRIGSQQIQASALEKLISTSWNEITEEASFNTLGEPEISGGFENLLNKFNPEKKLNISLEVDIEPKGKLKLRKGLEAKSEKVEFNPKEIEVLLEESQKQLATLVPIEDRAAVKGDIAVISFNGKYTENNKPIEGGKGESMDVELTEGKMIPGFIEGIIGMQINESKTIECKFPDDYPQEEARSKKATFEVILKELKYRELPILDDDFAKKTSDKSTMKELKEDLEKRLKKDSINKEKNNLQNSLLDVLVEQLEVELPKTLIEQEVKNIIERTARNFADQGIDVKSTFTPELIQSLMESSKPEAENNLLKSIAIKTLAEEEKLEVDKKDLKEKIAEISKSFKDNQNIDPERLSNIVHDDMLQEKCLSWLESNSNITKIAPPKVKDKKESAKKSKKTSVKKTTKTD